jgi:hypothetical protein
MSCRIKLYEMSRTASQSHVSLRAATVQLVAVQQANLTNCCPVQANERLIGGGYGVDLPFIPGSFVYQVAIIDVAKIYAGVMVSNLNGATPADLDVVLFKLPRRKVGVATGGYAVQVRTAIATNPYWNSEERQAVLSVMNALGSLRGTAVPLVLDFIAHYEQILAERGIDPGFF